MPDLPSVKAKVLLRAIEKCGFVAIRSRGSHRFLKHPDGRTLVFAFHDRVTVGPRMLARILKDARIEETELRRHL